MKTRRSSIPFTIFALMLVTAPVLGASSNELHASSRILFLNLTMIDGTLDVDGVKIVEGTLKPRRSLSLAKGRLYYILRSASGQTLHEGSIPDPSVVWVEYADSVGGLRVQKAKRDKVSFSIRLPFHEKAHTVTIRKIQQSIQKRELVDQHSEPLGSFVIDTRRGDTP